MTDVRPLTAFERERFELLEANVFQSLLAIRNERLYRESTSSFDAYCAERWGLDILVVAALQEEPCA